MVAVPSSVYLGGVNTRNEIDNFIPNMWTDDIIRYRDRKFHMASAVRTYNFIGQKGDELALPLVGRSGVYDRIPGQPVRLQVKAPGQYKVRVDQDKESSFGIDKIVKIQSQYDAYTAYVKEAGYAMARDLDNALLALRASVPTGRRLFFTSNGTAAGTPQGLSKAGIETAIQLMMEEDVDYEECHWVLSPNQLLDLSSVDEFISNDFNFANMRNGIVGTLYGLPVHVTTQITNNTLDGYRNGEGAPGEPTPGVTGSPYVPTQEDVTPTFLNRGQTGSEVANPFQTGMLVHPDWAVLLKQQNIMVETSRETLLQLDAFVTTHVYGAKSFRRDHAVLLFTQGSPYTPNNQG
jgi:hypothetical protein